MALFEHIKVKMHVEKQPVKNGTLQGQYGWAGSRKATSQMQYLWVLYNIKVTCNVTLLKCKNPQ